MSLYSVFVAQGGNRGPAVASHLPTREQAERIGAMCLKSAQPGSELVIEVHPGNDATVIVKLVTGEIAKVRIAEGSRLTVMAIVGELEERYPGASVVDRPLNLNELSQFIDWHLDCVGAPARGLGLDGVVF